ncbi:hypothetical protein J6590_026645 [Homalodisca vitripennis]|nr:hypothetical protein J6590_026645 [Homalodisca vitripennis]
MGFCKTLLLSTLLGLAVGNPLDRHVDKRDTSSHQIIEIPHHSVKTEDAPRHLDTHSPSFSYVGHHQTSSVGNSPTEKALGDRNDIPQTIQPRRKQTVKLTDQAKRRQAVGRKGTKKGKKSNVELLHHLGMAKIHSPVVNHHRKRLASQSRKTHHQKSNSDSKMFVIKLPPNPYYYAHHDLNGVDVVESQPKSVNTLPVNFNTNGKPSRVYHWNIPVLKKMVARKAGSSKSTIFADSDIFNIDKQATWNETDDDKLLYRKATYYGPKKSKHTFRKYFAGNGKPHSFYVMEKSKKPATVHRLLP